MIVVIHADSVMNWENHLGTKQVVVTLTTVEPPLPICAMHLKRANVNAEVLVSSVMGQASTASHQIASANPPRCVTLLRKENVSVEAVVDSAMEATATEHLLTQHLDQTTVPRELLALLSRRASATEATLVATATMRMPHLHR